MVAAAKEVKDVELVEVVIAAPKTIASIASEAFSMYEETLLDIERESADGMCSKAEVGSTMMTLAVMLMKSAVRFTQCTDDMPLNYDSKEECDRDLARVEPMLIDKASSDGESTVLLQSVLGMLLTIRKSVGEMMRSSLSIVKAGEGISMMRCRMLGRERLRQIAAEKGQDWKQVFEIGERAATKAANKEPLTEEEQAHFSEWESICRDIYEQFS
jgi:hypothetical protein